MNNEHKTDTEKLDALLRRTRVAQESHARAAQPEIKKGIFSRGTRPANDPSASGELPSSPNAVIEELRESAEDVRTGFKFLRDIKDVLMAGKRKIIDPVWNVIGPPLRFFGSGYAWLWKNFAYGKDEESGEKRINKPKAAILLAATFAAAVAATPTTPGEMVRYVTFDPVKDAAVMMLSMKKGETVYLSKTQEIDPANNVHRVQGCQTPVCTAKDTVTYNLEPRLSHTIWNMAAKGNPFFMTDRIAAAIPPGLNKCTVTSYSGRFAMAKYLQIYPQLLDVQCVPMTGFAAPAPIPAQ